MQSGFGFGAGVDPPLEPPELPEEPEPPDGLAALPDPEEDPPVLGFGVLLELPVFLLAELLEAEVNYPAMNCQA